MPLKIQDFTVLKQITRGSYGVFLSTKKTDTSKLYAIKMVSKEEMKNKNLTHQVTAERNALAISHCPYIVHLYYSLQTERNVYLIMEYLHGGDLKTLIIIYETFSLEHASIYCKEIMIALDYLHNHKIIHRDLKPDNILISNDGHLKLTDFGLSKVTLPNQNLQLNEILCTPSKKRAIQNTDYLRTPNQLFSLMERLEFNTNKVKPNKQPKWIPQTELKKKFNRPIREVQLPDVLDTSLPMSTRLSLDKLDSLQIDNFKNMESFNNFKFDDSINDSQAADKTDANSSNDQLCSLTSFAIPDYKHSIPMKASTPLQHKKVNFMDNVSRLTEGIHNLDLTNDGRVLGTPDYLPPEILVNSKFRLQGPPVDWWALGVILFEMLVGCTPFGGETEEEIFNNITKAAINWPEEGLDPIALDAIKGLLTQDPSDRWGYGSLSCSALVHQIDDSTEMPFIPVIDADIDTGYHDTRNQLFGFSMNHNYIEKAEGSE